MTLLFGAASVFHSYDGVLIYLVMAGVIALGALALSQKDVALPSPAGLAWMGFFSFISLSVLWSAAPYYSHIMWVTFACGIIMMIAASQPRFQSFGLSAVITTVVGTFLLVVDRAYYIDFKLPGLAIENYDPNAMAAALNASLFILIFYTTRIHSIALRKLIIAIIILAALGVVLSTSRGGLLCLLGGLCVFFAFNYKHPTLHHYRYAVAGLGGILAFTAMMITWYRFYRWIVFPLQDQSFIGRASLWKATAEIVSDYPLTGTGLGTFFITYPAYRFTGMDNSSGFFTHNDPLQFASEMGILGLVLFYCTIGFVAWFIFKLFRGLPAGSTARLAISALACALLTIFVNAHASYMYYIPIILFLWGLGLGLMAPGTPLTKSGRFGFICLLVVMGILLASVSASHYFLAKNNTDMAARYGTPLNPNLYYKQAEELISPFEALKAPLPSESEDMIHTLADQMQVMNPFSPYPDYIRARLALRRGDEESAIYFYNTALGRDPYAHRIRLDLVMLHRKRGEWGAVYTLTSKALTDQITPYYGGAFHRQHSESANRLMLNIVGDAP